MIRTKDGQDPRVLEDMFYAKQFAFSYSSLNKLLHSPGLFYRQYILGDREELMEASVIEGRVIHALLLDQESFSDQFVIARQNYRAITCGMSLAGFMRFISQRMRNVWNCQSLKMRYLIS